eukprot:3012860-Amphidinium_carterae.1
MQFVLLKEAAGTGGGGVEDDSRQATALYRLGFLAQLLVSMRHSCVHRAPCDVSVVGAIRAMRATRLSVVLTV